MIESGLIRVNYGRGVRDVAWGWVYYDVNLLLPEDGDDGERIWDVVESMQSDHKSLSSHRRLGYTDVPRDTGFLWDCQSYPAAFVESPVLLGPFLGRAAARGYSGRRGSRH
jgi:hypothetical protein